MTSRLPLLLHDKENITPHWETSRFLRNQINSNKNNSFSNSINGGALQLKGSKERIIRNRPRRLEHPMQILVERSLNVNNTSSVDQPRKEDSHINSCIEDSNPEAFVRYPKNNGSALKERTISNKEMQINNSSTMDGHNTSVIQKLKMIQTFLLSHDIPQQPQAQASKSQLGQQLHIHPQSAHSQQSSKDNNSLFSEAGGTTPTSKGRKFDLRAKDAILYADLQQQHQQPSDNSTRTNLQHPPIVAADQQLQHNLHSFRSKSANNSNNTNNPMNNSKMMRTKITHHPQYPLPPSSHNPLLLAAHPSNLLSLPPASSNSFSTISNRNHINQPQQSMVNNQEGACKIAQQEQEEHSSIISYSCSSSLNGKACKDAQHRNGFDELLQAKTKLSQEANKRRRLRAISQIQSNSNNPNSSSSYSSDTLTNLNQPQSSTEEIIRSSNQLMRRKTNNPTKQRNNHQWKASQQQLLQGGETLLFKDTHLGRAGTLNSCCYLSDLDGTTTTKELRQPTPSSSDYSDAISVSLTFKSFTSFNRNSNKPPPATISQRARAATIEPMVEQKSRDSKGNNNKTICNHYQRENTSKNDNTASNASQLFISTSRAEQQNKGVHSQRVLSQDGPCQQHRQRNASITKPNKIAMFKTLLNYSQDQLTLDDKGNTCALKQHSSIQLVGSNPPGGCSNPLELLSSLPLQGKNAVIQSDQRRCFNESIHSLLQRYKIAEKSTSKPLLEGQNTQHPNEQQQQHQQYENNRNTNGYQSDKYISNPPVRSKDEEAISRQQLKLFPPIREYQE